MLTQAGSNTFWDRSTLYALRGVFMAGEAEKALEYMKRYSATRLLGAHVPYAVEAWPEGGQRHLSTESALYGRIVTEGMFGIRPTGLHSFSMIPQLPKHGIICLFATLRLLEPILILRWKRVKGQTIRVLVKRRAR